ncbi:hypothetical protein [Streptomyces sp. NPDC014676]|uniref:hypothetical protein n=1 Tax=Streptomyces sp. NPDC014676 TaxID=3364879 RepID=UPI0036FC4623
MTAAAVHGRRVAGPAGGLGDDVAVVVDGDPYALPLVRTSKPAGPTPCGVASVTGSGTTSERSAMSRWCGVRPPARPHGPLGWTRPVRGVHPVGLSRAGSR